MNGIEQGFLYAGLELSFIEHVNRRKIKLQSTGTDNFKREMKCQTLFMYSRLNLFKP